MKPDQKQTLRYRIVTKRLRRTQGVEGGGAEGSPIRRTGARGQSECAACRCPRAAAACRYRSLLVLTTNVNKCEMTIDRQL